MVKRRFGQVVFVTSTAMRQPHLDLDAEELGHTLPGGEPGEH
ncbi:hypothetical protein OG223_52365 [Streptomyces sp. NBC_01478]|nr:hypothetical protein [Streptomyces sp. NBC_01478]